MDFRNRYALYHEVWSKRTVDLDEESLRNLGPSSELDGMTREQLYERIWKKGSVIVPPLLGDDGILHRPILAHEGDYVEHDSLQFWVSPYFDALALEEWNELIKRRAAIVEALEAATIAPILHETIAQVIKEIDARMWTLAKAVPSSSTLRIQN